MRRIGRRTGFLVGAALCTLVGACAQTPKEAPAPAPAMALPPPPPPGEPVELMGLDPVALRFNFGEPAFIRKDGHVEMWRYDRATCKAFFFLYTSGATLVVKHVETVPRGREMAADAGCLVQLHVKPATPSS